MPAAQKPLTWILLVSLTCASSVCAHKISIFAASDGETISGYAYLSGGGRVKNSPINVANPSTGETVTNILSDAEGRFSFQAESAQDYLLTIDLNDGHRAEWLVESPEHERIQECEDNPASTTRNGNPSCQRLSHQIAMLQEQIDTYEARVRFRDILGGIGYILGMTGILFYIMGARRKRQ